MENVTEQQLDHILTHNIDTIYPTKEAFAKRLKKSEPLTFYIGIDPNIPDVHLGHAVVYKKLEEFRKMGHTVICLIGDFTARIGDPTDKSAARVRLTADQVKENAQAYQMQVSKVLNFDDPSNPAALRFNSEWLDGLTFEDLIELAANFTVQQMLERDMFQNRLTDNKPIYLHEFFYPLMQGYDSVAMDVDVEVGGTDQTFNMLTGRDLVKTLKNKEKFVVTCPFLMGTDGEKMSKSKGNFISLRDEPFEMFRKIMTVNDDFIVHYYDMVLDLPKTEQEQLTKRLADGENPLEMKKELAYSIVEMLYDTDQAAGAKTEFEGVVQGNELPSEIQEIDLSNFKLHTSTPLVQMLNDMKLVPSKSEARRLIEQGAVKIDGEKIVDIGYLINRPNGFILQVGKKHTVRIVNTSK